MRILLATAILVVAGCGDASNTAVPPEAQSAAAALDQHAAVAGGDTKLTGGAGCKDKAEAIKLVAASKNEDQSEYINLWATGLQEQRCRGFAEGLGATVSTKDADGWSCIKPADDPDVDACYWVAPGRVG